MSRQVKCQHYLCLHIDNSCKQLVYSPTWLAVEPIVFESGYKHDMPC